MVWKVRPGIKAIVIGDSHRFCKTIHDHKRLKQAQKLKIDEYFIASLWEKVFGVTDAEFYQRAVEVSKELVGKKAGLHGDFRCYWYRELLAYIVISKQAWHDISNRNFSSPHLKVRVGAEEMQFRVFLTNLLQETQQGPPRKDLDRQQAFDASIELYFASPRPLGSKKEDLKLIGKLFWDKTKKINYFLFEKTTIHPPSAFLL